MFLMVNADQPRCVLKPSRRNLEAGDNLRQPICVYCRPMNNTAWHEITVDKAQRRESVFKAALDASK